jgi:hypothetical protein
MGAIKLMGTISWRKPTDIKKLQIGMPRCMPITEGEGLFYLNNYASKHNSGNSAGQVSQYHQFRRRDDPDSSRATLCSKWNQSLKARCILNDKLLKHKICFRNPIRNRDTNTPKSRRDDPDTAEPVELLKLKALEHSTASQQMVDGCLRDGNIPELEVLQPREKKRTCSINLGEITAADAGEAQGRREAERRRGQRARWHDGPIELKLLEAIKRGGSEPAVELGVQVMAEADVVKREAASWAKVCGKDVGDDGDELAFLYGKVEVYGEVERGGAPKVAPP